MVLWLQAWSVMAALEARGVPLNGNITEGRMCGRSLPCTLVLGSQLYTMKPMRVLGFIVNVENSTLLERINMFVFTHCK